jgi:O-antigen/teichoic acid export membrane protein
VSSDGSKTPNDDDLVLPNAAMADAPLSLGAQSARGLVYLFAGQSFTKVIGYVTRLLLLHLINKSQFGVVTLAQTITTFILLIGQSGVIDVLVHRRAFKQWAIPGFWLALALGILSCILIGISAPIAASIYASDPEVRRQLFWLLIASIPSPLPYALSVVPKAQLSRELRFRALAAVNIIDATLQNVFTLLFAAMGFGIFSFVLPIPVGGLILTVVLWWWVRPPRGPRLGLRRWRYLIGDSMQLLLSEFGRTLLDQSDYISLGLFHVPVDLVGVYRVGFEFSIQTMRLLMVNMTTILFPAFTKLKDEPQRQYEAFLNAQRILAMVGVSGCLLQAAVAEPLAHLFFPATYYPSIVVMQILSLGMATRMIAGGSFALLKSQGRFKVVRNNFWVYALVQVAVLAVVLSMGGGILEVSIVVSIVAGLAGPIMFYYAIRPYGGGREQVFDVLARPLMCGLFSVGAAWIIAENINWGTGFLPELMKLTEICGVSVALNSLLAWFCMRPVCDDLWVRVRRMLPRRARA